MPAAPDAARVPGHWPLVLLILGAGIVSAFQYGKVPIALPALQASLAVDLATASWLLSAFAVVGASLGLWIGLRVDAWGARRIALAGLVLQAIASAGGALTSSFAILLLLRVVEGTGFLAVIVAAPAMIGAVVTRQAQDGAYAAWGTFMPLGVGAMMLTAPWLEPIGWQGLWAANAGLLALYAIVLAAGTRRLGGSAQTAPGNSALRDVAARPAPWLIAGLFVIFSAMFFSIFGFLPTILVELHGVGLDAVGPLAAVAVVASALGTLACGRLLARGLSPMRLMMLGFVVMGAAVPGIVILDVSATTAYLFTLAMSLLSGLVPVVLFAAAARHAPSPSQAGTTMGMAMQGNNVGLLIGPAVAGAIAGAAGWAWIAAWIGLLALLALVLGRMLARLSPTGR